VESFSQKRVAPLHTTRRLRIFHAVFTDPDIDRTSIRYQP